MELQENVQYFWGQDKDKYPLSTIFFDRGVRHFLLGNSRRASLNFLFARSVWPRLNKFNYRILQAIPNAVYRSEIALFLPKYRLASQLLTKAHGDHGFSVIDMQKKCLLAPGEVFFKCSSGINILGGCIPHIRLRNPRKFDPNIEVRRFVDNLKSEKFLCAFESKLNRYFGALQSYLSNARWRRIICQSDSSPSARLLAHACSKANVQFDVLAHGYFQVPDLCSIAPIIARRLYVWTPGQRQDISQQLGASEREKVRYRGFFPMERPSAQQRSHADFHETVIILEPIDALTGDPGLIGELCRQLVCLDLHLKIKLHPSEVYKFDVVRRLLAIGNLAVEITKDSGLENRSSAVETVIGTNSSTLVEAAAYGIRCIQIAEFAKMSFEGVSVVECKDILKSLQSGVCQGGASRFPGFDASGCVEDFMSSDAGEKN